MSDKPQSKIVPPAKGNGVVDGSAGDDRIDLAYTGDPEGDRINNGDSQAPGSGPDDDVVDAGAGDDRVEAGAGDDTVYAGSGADTVLGESGNDTIYGDGNLPGGSQGTVREVFQWDQAPDPDGPGEIDAGDDLSGGFTQDTGHVTVTYSMLGQSPAAATGFTDVDQSVTDIETDGAPADAQSGLDSVLNGVGNEAAYELAFSDEVSNVSFRINDIDGDGVVRVLAYDGEGNAVPVTLTAGGNVTLSDTDAVPGNDTADSNGGYGPETSNSYSALVDIPGPVARLVIEHGQDGWANSGITVTDVYFDTFPGDGGAAGDDVLDGGDGDDIIFGEGGDDTLIGGRGDDVLDGGDGDDRIIGGDGSDTVEGGDGDDVIDTSGTRPLPDRGFPSYAGLPAVPADPDPYNDRDVVDGGDGDDIILTGDDEDVIRGGSGNDTIDAGLDDDTVDGGDGDDFIVGGEGSDTISGGAGDDTIYGGLDPVFPDVLNIRDDGSAGPADPDPTNGRDVIDGGDGDDTIFGQDDDDTLFGGAGDDYIDGGIDEDEIHGGSGDDILLGGQGADTIFGDDDADTIGTGIGDVVEGGEGGDDNDTLIATGLATVTYDPTDPTGESGTVTYYNADLTVAGTSDFSEIENAYVIGGPGSGPTPPHPGPTPEGIDGIVEGTDGDDVIDLGYTGDPNGDLVDGDDAVPPLTGEQDIILGFGGDDTIHGRDDTDIIFGGTGDDTVFGDGGNDAIDGGAGDDVLDGGAGRDIVIGGAGDDTISGSNTTAGDGGDILAGNDGDDTFVDIGQGEVVFGGEDADGQDTDTLDLTGAAEAANPGGSLAVEYDPADSENGVVRFFDASGTETGTTAFFDIERVIPCFTPGTLIATPMGERKVEDLRVGDRVITRDNGIQEIRWVGRRDLSVEEMRRAEHLKPVLIRTGALGNGLPERDMLVSPNHRVLIANEKTALYFDDREVLVAAKHLTGIDGIDSVAVDEVAYIHFMFDQHEVVLSDGAWTESFQPGDQTLAGMDDEQRDEIFELFPELKTREGLEAYSSARRSLKRHEARLLVH